MYIHIVHRIHGYWCCLLFLLLFIVYTITVYWYTVLLLLLITVYMITVYWYTVLLMSLSHPSILVTWILIVITELNNNANEQFISGLGKLMEETASVFWVDLKYRLCSRDRVPLQGSQGWLTSHTVTITVVSGGTVWFNARHLNRDYGYVRNPPKIWTMSPTYQF